MNVIKRGNLFGHDWYIRLGRRVTVNGVNSLTGKHESVLFWEFDGKSFRPVSVALTYVQHVYELPEIHILQASNDASYHAVCFERLPWFQALRIVLDTEYVDPEYIRLAAYRGHFTLRLSDKGMGIPKVVHVLESNVPPSANIADLKTGVRYGAWMRENLSNA